MAHALGQKERLKRWGISSSSRKEVTSTLLRELLENREEIDYGIMERENKNNMLVWRRKNRFIQFPILGGEPFTPSSCLDPWDEKKYFLKSAAVETAGPESSQEIPEQYDNSCDFMEDTPDLFFDGSIEHRHGSYTLEGTRKEKDEKYLRIFAGRILKVYKDENKADQLYVSLRAHSHSFIGKHEARDEFGDFDLLFYNKVSNKIVHLESTLEQLGTENRKNKKINKIKQFIHTHDHISNSLTKVIRGPLRKEGQVDQITEETLPNVVSILFGPYFKEDEKITERFDLFENFNLLYLPSCLPEGNREFSELIENGNLVKRVEEIVKDLEECVTNNLQG